MARPEYRSMLTGDEQHDTFPWSVVLVSPNGDSRWITAYTHRQTAEDVAYRLNHPDTMPAARQTCPRATNTPPPSPDPEPYEGR